MPDLFIKEQGQGKAVVLLHGFPFNHTIWNPFAAALSKRFHVITLDLPGFGRSPLPTTAISMEVVADLIIRTLQARGVNDAVLIGHSLGGYVALAMIEKAPELFSSLVLFHSTSYADSEEKKQSRDKVLEFIDKHGVKKFTSNFINPLFANSDHEAIESVREIATQASEETVRAYTMAMRDRKERTEVIRSFRKPVLFITGDKDPGIPVSAIEQQSKLNNLSETHVLTNVAHMGMLESERQTLEIITTFIQKKTVTS